MSTSRLAAALVRAAVWIVPADLRVEWRREWETELIWARQQRRRPATQLARALGAWKHALWLRTDRWRWEMVIQDVRYAARALASRPAFALTAIASLALGIGANIAIFTVVDGVLLRPLPFADSGRVVQLANGDSPSTLSGPELVDLTRDARTLATVGAYAFADANVTGGPSDAERVRVARVTAGFFRTLGTPLALGRAFTNDEDRPGGPAVVVVSEALWARHRGDRSISDGPRLDVDGTPRTIVGVMPAGFDFPSPAVDVWVPLALDPADPGERRNHNFRVVAHLAEGATPRTAEADVAAITAGWQARFPDVYSSTRPLVADVVTIGDRVLGATRPYLVAMLGAVAFVLLIACVNVAGLLLTYGEGRRKDLAICAAMGASRRRLVVRSLSEGLLLSVAGGALGFALALPAFRLLVSLAPASIPRLAQVRLDPAVAIFALVATFITGLASSAVPLLRARGDADAAMLRSAGRPTAASGTRANRRVHAALVAGQVALAVTMLAGAGYLTRSLLNLQRADLGFDARGVLTARLTLPRRGYDDGRAIATVRAVVEELQQSPGVVRAAAMAWTPIVDGGGMWSVMSDIATPATNAAAPLAAPQQVTPGFFDALSIPILRGRAFTNADAAGAELVAVVNHSFGRLLWDTADPVGHRFRMFSDTSAWVTVVGLVPDTRVDGLTDAKPPIMYFPHAQASRSAYFTSLAMTLVMRYHGDRAPLVADLRRVVRSIDDRVPISDVRGLDDVVGASISRERFTAVVVSGFAAVAALLTGIGMYGLIAYGVAQRRFEIGLRMALGAAKSRIVSDVVRRGLMIAAAGLAIGLAGAVVLGRLLKSLLVGVSAFDPGVLAIVAALLLAVAVAALIVPARRAMRVNPTDALHHF